MPLAALSQKTASSIAKSSARSSTVSSTGSAIKTSNPNQPIRELSGGNQQKVLLARWLCLNPKLLILDEPTRGIDVGAKAEIQGLIDELAEAGLGVLMISSEIEEITEGSDRVTVLRDGRHRGGIRPRADRARTPSYTRWPTANRPSDTRWTRERWRLRKRPRQARAHPCRQRERRFQPTFPLCYARTGTFLALAVLIIFNMLFTTNFLSWGPSTST